MRYGEYYDHNFSVLDALVDSKPGVSPPPKKTGRRIGQEESLPPIPIEEQVVRARINLLRGIEEKTSLSWLGKKLLLLLTPH